MSLERAQVRTVGGEYVVEGCEIGGTDLPRRVGYGNVFLQAV